MLVIVTILFGVLKTEFHFSNNLTSTVFAQGAGNSDSQGFDDVVPDPTYPVQVIIDIVYGQGLRRSSWHAPDGEVMELKLDAYLPVTPSSSRLPAIMLFHGGGFEGGDKAYPNMVAIADYYASRGWAVFSVNYRLEEHHGSIPEEWPWDPSPKIYPAGRDAKAAVRWLHANAAQYNVSPDHITVFGGSAGGMLALMLGTTDPEDYRDEIDVSADPTLLTTNLEASSEVQTVIAFWGSSGLLKALEIYDGNSRYDNHDSPTMLAHGTMDTTIPIHESETIFQALREVGVPVDFHILEGEGHSAWEANLADGRTLFEAAFDYIVLQQNLSIGDTSIFYSTYLPFLSFH